CRAGRRAPVDHHHPRRGPAAAAARGRRRRRGPGVARRRARRGSHRDHPIRRYRSRRRRRWRTPGGSRLMDVASHTLSAAAPMPRARVLRAYVQEARSEVLSYLREPAFLLPIMLFPAVFYLMFGVVLNRGSADVARYLLGSYSTFAVMAPGLFGFGVSLALERGEGLLELKRALPMPP